MRKIALAAAAAALLAAPAYAQTIGEDIMMVYIFGRLDANKDGVVSQGEFSSLFAAADTDRSNGINLNEMIQQKEREKAIMFQALTGKR